MAMQHGRPAAGRDADVEGEDGAAGLGAGDAERDLVGADAEAVARGAWVSAAAVVGMDGSVPI
jgi:hypothetical protein